MHNAAMRTLFLLSLVLLTGSGVAGQAPAQPAPAAPRPTQTAQPAPAAPRPAPTTPPAAATPAPAPRRPAAPTAPARSGIALTVTDGRGLPLANVKVTIAGTSDREGTTDTSGQVSFVGMQAGTYRVRFEGEKVTSFEREVTVRANQPTVVDVALTPAPPPPAPVVVPAPAPAAAPPVVGPAGSPQVLSIVDLAERQLGGNQPRRETLVSCSGNTRTTLVLLNQDQAERLYDNAEIDYYVVAGQGAIRLSGRETPLAAGTFVSLPRSTGHSVVRRGNRALILLVTLSGEPCEEAK